MVFGHKTLYVGPDGWDYLSGVCVVLKGKPKNIAKNIKKRFGIDLEKVEDSYMLELNYNLNFLLFPHPKTKGQSVFLLGYLDH